MSKPRNTKEELAKRIAENIKPALMEIFAGSPLIWDMVDMIIRDEILATPEEETQIWLDPFKNKVCVTLFGCDEPMVSEFYVAGLDMYNKNPSKMQAQEMWGEVFGARKLVEEINSKIDELATALDGAGFPRKFGVGKMSDTPERIAVWRFRPEKADEWVHGGWSEDHDHKTTEYIRADLAPQWQPIETAPKDERLVLVWLPLKRNAHAAFDISVKFAKWLPDLEEWQVAGISGSIPPQPTHWMPLPEPPELA